ncbi:MAG: DUF2490 domain-containing protein [Saprospiraceae bacterium]|nr:DUF2490 domain-containing protein [Saprospiraceae bacterium]
MMKQLFLLIIILLSGLNVSAQVNPDALGGWYMYFWNTKARKSGLGAQGDIQYRNWNVMGDLEQLLLRAGLTYSPKGTKAKFTLGYAFILTGDYGFTNPGTTNEHRIYQEALIPHKIGKRIYLNHRFRFEQRFVQNQAFRMRIRYNLFINIALNKSELKKGAFYIGLYNELFINTGKDIGNGATVEIFDRNRLYGALGYHILDNLKVQLGYMYQSNNSYGKGQLQLSVHHAF